MRKIPEYLEPVAAMALLNLAHAGMISPLHSIAVIAQQKQIDAAFDAFIEEGVYGE